MKSTAPTLVYEEGSLVKRSIRDLYNKDIDEIVVAGENGYKDAKDFMRMLMPSHAKNVKLYRDTQPVFTRYGIESQLDAMFSPTVQLRSGGYIVINQTEALVAIDVNSGRSTREHHIEDTALKTNVEASEEVARQLRLRDLAGLIVIDFIDMDEKRNNRTVERRLKDALRNDRARIQVGRISHFGLMEMSRQRIRTSVLESSTEKCPHCGGTGHVRSVSSVALQLLRSIEEMLLKGATHNLIVRTRPEIALYVLNHKRAHLRELEERFQITLTVNCRRGGRRPDRLHHRPRRAGDDARPGQGAAGAGRRRRAGAARGRRAGLPRGDRRDERRRGGRGRARRTRRTCRRGARRRADDHQPMHGDARRMATALATAAAADAARRGRGGRGGEGREGGPFQPRHEHGSPEAGETAARSGAELRAAGRRRVRARRRAPEPGFARPRPEGGEPHINGDGEPRRRRRGRRGGRRNRRDGAPGNGDFAATPGSGNAPAARRRRAAGLVAAARGVTARTPPEPTYAPRIEPAPRPEPAAVAASAPPQPAAAEPPRRRSTVREPAPVFSGSAPVLTPMPAPPPPAPTVISTADGRRRKQAEAQRLVGEAAARRRLGPA